jgi:PadR family transcriptional regulator PadR
MAHMHEIATPPDLFENLRLELRRGSLVVAVLAALRSERYGYTLRKTLADHGLEIDENTLYPLLRRLESQGLLASVWREENKRNKRFYRLSSDGEQMLARLLEEWESIHASVNEVLKKQQENLKEPEDGLTAALSQGR